MKRLHLKKIDDAEYYNKNIWAEEVNLRPYYDAVRMRALIRDVKTGYSVLDVGAGVFGACQYISENTDLECSLFCFDQSSVAKEIVEKRCPDISYILGEVEKGLSFFDKKFDVVIAGEIIEHLERPDWFAKELCRVGKKVALSTVDTESENAIKHGDYPEHLWSFTKEDLISFFAPYCKNVEFLTVGDYQMIYAESK